VASLVEDVANEGDAWAQALIDTGAAELSLAARAVCDRLSLPDGPVILAGGIFRAVPRLRAGMINALTTHQPGIVVRALTNEPAAGAVSLALAAAEGTLVTPAYFDHE
jgi:N-acetylglucosamine kinase-like BadF-type ATPase